MKLTHAGQLLVIGCMVGTLAGCATMRQKESPETMTLKTQISDLESQVKQKDAEIDSLRRALSRTTEDKYSSVKMSRGSEYTTVLPTATQIQTALKNAGYSIVVDGKMGSATKAAIKDFQKANSLEADGKVGKKTWSMLEPYLNKQ
jgi:peptidoglycan hydrolase-like protein with peptidoglycan-binding domain